MATFNRETSDDDFQKLKDKLIRFMHSDIYPNERLFLEQSRAIGHAGNEWTHAPILVKLKRKAKAMGLWNLFLPVSCRRPPHLIKLRVDG